MRRIISALFLITLVGCQSRYESLLDKAIYESSRQRTQVAQYLFSEIIREHETKDFVRFQALLGLKNVFLTQRFDYKRAMTVTNKIIDEYGNLESYQIPLRQVRTQGAEILRIHFEDPDQALDLLSPLLGKEDLSVRIEQELGKVYLAKRSFEMAEHRFKRAWVKANANQDCLQTKTLQLDIMQTYALNARCEEALSWSKQTLPASCDPDEFAMTVEKAHCYEMTGDINKAIEEYKSFVESDPDHARAHFFLERLKKRKADRQRK